MDGYQQECSFGSNSLWFTGYASIMMQTHRTVADVLYRHTHTECVLLLTPSLKPKSQLLLLLRKRCQNAGETSLQPAEEQLLGSKWKQAGQSIVRIWPDCSPNEVSLSTTSKATGSLHIFPLYCKYRNRWSPKEKRIYILYISRFPQNITKGKLLKNFNQVTELVWIKNLSALFSLISHVCVIASICIYGPNILKHQHSHLKSAVLRLCTRNFYLIKILI